MNQGFTYTDHKDVDLQVTLKTGAIFQGLRCSLLRTYSEQYDTCDAHALICYSCINKLGVNHMKKVESNSFELFKTPDGRLWKVESYKETFPPDAPGLIFRLKALETDDDDDDNDIEPDFNYSSYEDDPYEGVDWGDPSTFNQAAWDNVPDRD
ncbi:MAG: hypothetical protein F6K03_09730 [Kamptonema sp. SIO4C4]|nr:hypothetical protein [Kamptonema sp. SIO4C4]